MKKQLRRNNMSIILNEKKFAESAIVNGFTTKNVKETVFTLSKYYHSLGLSINEIHDNLDKFMSVNYQNYNPVEWSKVLDYDISKMKNHPLIELEYVPITKNELITIQEIKGVELQRLAFTLLCIAKYGNMTFESNNDWAARDSKEIFTSARIKKTVENRGLMFHELMTLRLIGYSKLPDNTHVKVKFIDNDSETILQVKDLNNLGSEFRFYLGEKFVRCEECGILMKPKTDIKRCSECNTVYRREYFRIKKQEERN